MYRWKRRFGLHAVTSSEVSVDEVLAAEVLHPSGDICHELHQHLRRQKLKHRKMKVLAFILFCTVEGAPVFSFSESELSASSSGEAQRPPVARAVETPLRFGTFADLMAVSTLCVCLVLIRPVFFDLAL